LDFSRLAQRSLTLRPAYSPSHFHDPLHQRLQPLCYLRDCSGCYRLEQQLPGGLAPTKRPRLLLGAPHSPPTPASSCVAAAGTSRDCTSRAPCCGLRATAGVSIQRSFHPSSCSWVEARDRNPCQLISVAANPSALSAAVMQHPDIGRSGWRNCGKTQRRVPVRSRTSRRTSIACVRAVRCAARASSSAAKAPATRGRRHRVCADRFAAARATVAR
jgi:hypothetical protein